MNLVKDSLLNIVHIIFAHAARTSKNGAADSSAVSTDSRFSRSASIPAVHSQDTEASAGLMPRTSSHRSRENGRARAVAEAVDVAGTKSADNGDAPAMSEKKPGYGQSAAGHILMFLVKLAKVCPRLTLHAPSSSL